MTDDGVMRVLEEGALERHISEKGAKCPFCDSSDIHSGEMGLVAGDFHYSMECFLCEGQWTDIYGIVGVEALGEGMIKIFPDSE